ncbi:MAG: TetR/AcrR family transcriptional regulator [Mycobacteriaceae bacterium]
MYGKILCVATQKNVEVPFAPVPGKKVVPNDSDTAKRILDGALRAAEIHGLNRLTMNQIATQSGLARVTLYTKFTNRESIIEALVARELSYIFGKLDLVSEQNLDIDNKITEVFVCAYQIFSGHALFQRLLRTEPESILPYIAYSSPFLDYGRDWVSHMLLTSISCTEEEALTTAELTVRTMQSLLLSPNSIFNLTEPEQLRELATKWIIPSFKFGTKKPKLFNKKATNSQET